MAGHHDNRQTGPEFKKLSGQLHTGHFRHGLVGDDEVEMVRIVTEQLQGLLAVTHPHNLAAEAAQHLPAKLYVEQGIINKKHPLIDNRQGGLFPLFLLFNNFLFGHRKIDGKIGAMAWLAQNGYLALMAFDNAVDRGQAETGALSRFLGAKIGVKNPLHYFRLNPVTAVRHAQAGVWSGRQVRDIARGQFHLNKLDTKTPPLFLHGMVGIGGEIHYHLVNLGRVGVDCPAQGINLFIDFNGCRQRSMQKCQALLYQTLHMQGNRLLPGLPAEGQNLVDQFRCPLAGLADFRNPRVLAALRRGVLKQQIRIAQDRIEHVVKIMGHAAGQGADGLHLLGLEQLGSPFFDLLFKVALVLFILPDQVGPLKGLVDRMFKNGHIADRFDDIVPGPQR